MPRAVELAQVQDEFVVAAGAVDQRGELKNAPPGMSQKAIQQPRVSEGQCRSHRIFCYRPLVRGLAGFCAKQCLSWDTTRA